MLRLQYGNDKVNPIRQVDLTGSNISFLQDGFSPGSGAYTPTYINSVPGRDGNSLLTSRRENANVSITYHIKAGETAARISQIQREVNEFALYARACEERNEGQKVWLAFRLYDKLDLPEPVLGNLSSYMRVISLDVPGWSEQIHLGGALEQGFALGMVANLVLAPYGELADQQAGLAEGNIQEHYDGTFIGYDETYFSEMSTSNGSKHFYYNNGSAWNNGWTASGALDATQETRNGYTASFNSAAYLTNSDSTDEEYTCTTSALVTADHWFSCLARKVDGSAVSSSDFQLYIGGSAITTTYEAINKLDHTSGWYWCYGSYSATSGSLTLGVQVKSGKSIIVDNLYLQAKNSASSERPLWPGHPYQNLGHNLVSNRHESEEGKIQFTMPYALGDQFTISGWFKPMWDSYPNVTSTDNLHLFEFIDSGGLSQNIIKAYYDVSAGNLVLYRRFNGTSSTNSYSTTFNFDQWYHIAVVQDGLSCYLYLDNTVRCTVSSLAGASFSNGTFYLGNEGSGTDANGAACECVFDGWRIWSEVFSSTVRTNVYSQESPVKAAYGKLGTLPYIWSSDRKGSLKQTEAASPDDNYVVIGGIPGDVDALCRYEVALTATGTQANQLWLGMKSWDVVPKPDSLFWHYTQQTSGTVADGATDSITYDVDETHVEALRGEAKIIMKAEADDAHVGFIYQLGAANWHSTDTESIDNTEKVRIFSKWQPMINWPVTPKNLKVGIVIDNDTGGNVDGTITWLMILPSPFLGVEVETSSMPTIAAGDTIIIDGDYAWLTDASSNDEVLRNYKLLGKNNMRPLPGKYNMILGLQAQNNVTFDATLECDITAVITPRVLLPGGWTA